MEEVVPGGSIASRMPLEATEKAVDAFSEGARYHPTFEGTKRISELPRGSETLMEKIHEMNAQFYGWSTDPETTNYIDILLFLFALGVLTIVGMVIWTAIRLFVEWVVGNKD